MGATAQPVHIRCPGAARQVVQAGLLRNAAIATSAVTATMHKGDLKARTMLHLDADTAYSVVAPTCLLADALTKVLVQLENPDAGCFARLGARAFVMSAGAINGKAA